MDWGYSSGKQTWLSDSSYIDNDAILDVKGGYKSFGLTSSFVLLVMQDDNQWLQLPYEIAHGIVRTVTKHVYDYLSANSRFKKLVEEDPEQKKSKTVNAQINVKRMEHVDLFIIFNRRTGQIATPEWTSKHLAADSSGRPVLKNQSAKVKPWVMTLRLRILEVGDIQIGLRSGDDDSEFKEVRCFDLDKQLSNKKIANIAEGYGHLLQNLDTSEDQEENFSPSGVGGCKKRHLQVLVSSTLSCDLFRSFYVCCCLSHQLSLLHMHTVCPSLLPGPTSGHQ